MAGTRAAIYARLSQHRGTEQSASTVRQEAECRRLAAERGLEVVEVLIDDDASAYSGKRRPGYVRACEMIAGGEIDALLAWAPDRLHRSPRELEDFVDLIERSGAEVITVQSGRIDLSTPAGRMQARMLGSIARYESEHRSERVKIAKEQRARQGLWGGGPRPYGYSKVGDGELVIETTEAETVREIAARFLAGESLRSIGLDLNARGVPAPRGGTWGHTQVRQVLTRRSLAGRLTYQGEDAGPAPWPAIVSPDEHALITHRLEQAPKRRRAPRVSLLTGGRLVCGCCGGALVTSRQPKDRGGARLYKCGACHGVSIKADPLDEAIAEAVVELLDAARPPRPSRRRGRAALEIEKIDADLDALIEEWSSGRISRREWTAGREILTRRKAEAESAWAEDLGSPVLSNLSGKGRASAAWPDLSLDRRQAVIDALIASITVAPSTRRVQPIDLDRLEIEWRA